MRISTLLFTCAIGLSAIAAYYSIVGLATIFSSAYVPVIIMAGMLEISKLVVASWLYQKWHIVTGAIKVYLTSAVVVLMLITSLGIFGFLSKAHVEQSINNESIRLRIEQIDSQISGSQDIIRRYQSQLDQLDRSINIQLDANRPTQALQARQRQQAERERIRQQLDGEQQKLTDLGQQRLLMRQQINELESEVGPIRYVAEFFSTNPGEVDLEKSVRWMIVVLILVFDPLAVLMLIAANMSYKKESLQNSNDHGSVSSKKENDGPVIGEIIQVDGKPFRWWDGQQWQPMDPATNNKDVQSGVSVEYLGELLDKISTSIESIRMEKSPPPPDIRDSIKAAMDEWLTTVSVDNTTLAQHAQMDESSKGKESLSKQEAKITEKPTTEPELNNKPSWL